MGGSKPKAVECLGSICHRVRLPDGTSLHSSRRETEHRVFVWVHDTGELRILAGKRQIFGALQELKKRFGDLTKYDVMVACEPAQGRGGRKYTVSATPDGKYDLEDDVTATIAETITDEVMALINPVARTVDETVGLIPGATLMLPSEDESLLETEPEEETE